MLDAFRRCGRGCGTVVIEEPEPKRLVPGPNFRQRDVRLNTGAAHAIAFCAVCAAQPIGADGPTILLLNQAVFEEAWAHNETPEDTRARHRAEMAGWTILGWADEIPAPPMRVCADCQTGIPLAAAKFCPHCGARLADAT